MLTLATSLCDPPSTCSLDNPPNVSAEELHEILLLTHSTGNTARRRFIDSLRALSESRLYRQLGYPSIAAYADATFHFARTQVFEFLRVSKALVDLPRIAAAFERGEITWSLVAELTRVTDREHEGEWLEFLRGRPVRSVEAELRDARVKHRRHPRKHGYGLPGLPVRLSFELAPEDHAVVARGLEKVASEMSDSLDGARPAPVEALVYLLRRVLETEESVTQGRAVLFVTARVAAVPTPSAGRRPGLQDTATTSDSAPMVGARISGTRPGAASGVTPPFTPAA